MPIISHNKRLKSWLLFFIVFISLFSSFVLSDEEDVAELSVHYTSTYDVSTDVIEASIGGQTWEYPDNTKGIGGTKFELAPGQAYTLSLTGVAAIDPPDNIVSGCGYTVISPDKRTLLDGSNDSSMYFTDSPFEEKDFSVDVFKVKVSKSADPIAFMGEAVCTAQISPYDLPFSWSVVSAPSDCKCILKGLSVEIHAGCIPGVVRLSGRINALPLYEISTSIEIKERINDFGGGRFFLDSMNADFGLGLGWYGKPLGAIKMKVDKPHPFIYHPCILECDIDFDEVSFVRDHDYLRQVLVPEGLVDITSVDANSFRISFYATEDVSESMENGLYTVELGADPFVEYVIYNPDMTNDVFNRVYISEYKGEGSNLTKFVWNEETPEWAMDMYDGDYQESITEDNLDDVEDEIVINRYVMDSDSTVYQHTQEYVKRYSWGDLLKCTIQDPDGLCLITSNTYDIVDNDTNNPVLVQRVEEDGKWFKYEYDDSRHIIKEVHPWLDQDHLSTESIFYISNSFESIGYGWGDSGNCYPRTPRLSIAYVNDIITKKTYRAYETNDVVRREHEWRCIDQNAIYYDDDNLRETKVFTIDTNLSETLQGRIIEYESDDGTCDWYSYDFGFVMTNGAAYEFSQDATGSCLRISCVHGRVGSTNGVANKTTKSVQVVDRFGSEVLTEDYVYTGTGYEQIQWIYRQYDENHHPTNIINSRGLQETINWGTGCCGKDSEMNQEGVEHVYTYNQKGDLLTLCKVDTNGALGLTKTYTYDPLGNQLSETVSGGGLSLFSSNVYDAVGRMSYEEKPGTGSTHYSYPLGGRTVVVVQNGVTNQTEYYIDGRIELESVNGVLIKTYEYGVNTNGSQWTVVYEGSEGTDSPRWVKTTYDLLGRLILEEKPAYEADGTVNPVHSTEWVYDNNNRQTSQNEYIVQNSSTQLVKRLLFSYDIAGARQYTAQDINLNGSIDWSGPDVITEERTYYEEISNDWYRVRASITYPWNTSTPFTNACTKERLTGLGTSSASGVLVSEVQSIDANGNISFDRTYVDRDNKRKVRRSQIAGMADVENEYVNGLQLLSVNSLGGTNRFSYDGIEREIWRYDVRGNGIFTHYNTNGLIDYIENGVSSRTSYSYDDAGRRMSQTDAYTNTIYYQYDERSRLIAEWGTDYPVAYDYDEYGNRTAMYTMRGSNTIENGYSDIIANSDCTVWQYDTATGLLTNKCYASTNAVTYEYDALGNLVKRAWSRGIETEYMYEDFGSLTNVSYSDGTPSISYDYTRDGRLQYVYDIQGIRTFLYDNGLSLTGEIVQVMEYMGDIKRVFYSRDGYGRKTGLTYRKNSAQAEEISYSYDAMGRISSITSPVLGSVTYSYIPGSTMITNCSVGKFSMERQYADSINQIISVTNQWYDGTNNVDKNCFLYNYDLLGRRIAMETIVGTNYYSYSARSEVIGAVCSTNEYEFNYDDIGNRSFAIGGGTTNWYGINNDNQYTNVCNNLNTNEYAFDADGNQLNWQGWTLEWNGENRLSEASNGSTRIQFSYDYQGRRIGKAVLNLSGSNWITNQAIEYLYDGWNVVAEYTESSGLVETNVYYWGIDLSGNLQGAGGVGGLLAVKTRGTNALDSLFYAANDANGNVVSYLQTNGVVAASYIYSPFGQVISLQGVMATNFNVGFSSKWRNGLNLIYYGYRFYNPELGRWISRDPAGQYGGVNLYAFIKNNSINAVDFRGLWRWLWEGCCAGEKYNRFKSCCCCGGKCVRDGDDNCDKISKKKIPSKIRYEKLIAPASGGKNDIHWVVHWPGGSADSNAHDDRIAHFTDHANFWLTMHPGATTQWFDEELSPCKYDFKALWSCLTKSANDKDGKKEGMCWTFKASLVNGCKAQSKGCRKP